jgi:ribose transport system substrate-binding protein
MTRLTSVVLGALLLAMAGTAGLAQSDGRGITDPVALPPFDPGLPKCAAPVGLAKVIAFAQDNEREFMQGVSRGLKLAAADRGLDYRVLLANNDGARMIGQIDGLRAEKVGAVIVAPVDPVTLAPALRNYLGIGGYVGAIVPPPATTILNAPQYLTGKTLADAAVAYIRDRLGGKADVVILTHDSLQFLAPRFAAIRDALKDLPDVTIVADISPVTVNREGGYTMMKTILLANPDVDVVLGADTVVLGALDALREAGKERQDQFLGGIDGEPDAIRELKEGRGAYKASVSLNSPVFAYALGQMAADWLEGKRVPQAIDILPRALTAENLVAYEADLADPAAVYRDEARRSAYLKMYGSICFDSRGDYLDFPWSSER